MRDQLPEEEHLRPDVIRERGQDRGVGSEVERTAGGRLQVRDEIHCVRGRAAVAEGEQLAAGVETRPQRGGRGLDGFAVADRPLTEGADLAGLDQHRAGDVVAHGVGALVALLQEWIEEA